MVAEVIGLAGRQVAEQQGRYLAKALNEEAKARAEGSEIQVEPFRYKQLGAMASVGVSIHQTSVILPDIDASFRPGP